MPLQIQRYQANVIATCVILQRVCVGSAEDTGDDLLMAGKTERISLSHDTDVSLILRFEYGITDNDGSR